MSTKFDRKAAMRSTLSAEKKDVNDRFAVADAVLASRPSGYAVAPAQDPERTAERVTFSAESSRDKQQRVVSVPLDLVHPNPLNARHLYSSDLIKDLAASIATRGQLTPASATAHPDRPGEYLLIDGHYRKRAIAAAGLPTIDLLVRPHEGDIELYRMSWVLNEERSAQSPLDNAYAWRLLIEKKILQSETQIAELTGVSLSTVNKTLALLALPSSAIEKMREKPQKFGVFSGYELSLAAKKLSEIELLKLIDRIIVEDLSSREVGALRAKLESGTQRKRKETSRQYKIKNADKQIGLLKEWDSGKVTFEVLLNDPKERAALIADLRIKFGVAD